MDPNKIREINAIPKGMRIKAGSTIIVPKGNKSSDVPTHLAENASLKLEKEVAAKKKKAHNSNQASQTKKANTAKNSPRKEQKVADSRKKPQ
jgi:membrane-bound lytic murein transglycosylase D